MTEVHITVKALQCRMTESFGNIMEFNLKKNSRHDVYSPDDIMRK